MNAQKARSALVLANFALVLGTGGLAWWTFFRKHEAPPNERVPAFLPSERALPNVAKPPALETFKVIWTEIEKPPPPPPPAQPPPPPKLPDDLSTMVRLVSTFLDEKDAANNQVIAAPLPVGEQVTLRIGEVCNHFKLEKLEACLNAEGKPVHRAHFKHTESGKEGWLDLSRKDAP